MEIIKSGEFEKGGKKEKEKEKEKGNKNKKKRKLYFCPRIETVGRYQNPAHLCNETLLGQSLMENLGMRGCGRAMDRSMDGSEGIPIARHYPFIFNCSKVVLREKYPGQNGLWRVSGCAALEVRLPSR
jgi:hypothetical protein